MNALNDDILLLMECPSCMEYVNAPIYVCVTGHSICKDCWIKLDKCPTCRKDLSDTRNYNLEKVAEQLFYPCQNSDYGCNDRLKLTEMDEHSLVCSYRNYNCKFPNCAWKCRRDEIEDHYLTCHRHSVLIGHETKCWWRNTKHDVYLLLAYKELFSVHNIMIKNCMYWVVQYIGKSEDVIQYCFQITIHSDQFQNRKITISEVCQDDLKDDITEIVDSGYAAGVPVSTMDSYKNELGHVWYTITIKKT